MQTTAADDAGPAPNAATERSIHRALARTRTETIVVELRGALGLLRQPTPDTSAVGRRLREALRLAHATGDRAVTRELRETLQFLHAVETLPSGVAADTNRRTA